MEDISVAYVDSEGDELPIESECEFQEALKYARHRARKGREIVLKLDGHGVPLSQTGSKAPAKVREAKPKHTHKLATKPGTKSSSVEKIRNSIVQASLMRPIIPMHRFTAAATGTEEKKVKVKKHATVEDDDSGKLKKAVLDDLTAWQELLLRKLRADWDDSPPQWFKKYMQKVKSEIIAEVTTNVLFANRQVVELVERRMQEYGTMPSTVKKPRKKKKKNGSDEDSDCPQDSDLGSSKLLKKLEKLHKQEKKLDCKLEKLETKTKRRLEKKSLQQPMERKVSSVAKKKCSGSGGSAGPYLMDAIVLYDGQQGVEARALIGTAFTKVWEIMNNGTLPWTDKTELRLTWGTPGLEPEETAICCPILNPGEKGHISINFKPPDMAGTFETYWHFYHMGERFGHWLCCAVVVDSRDARELDQKAKDEQVEVDKPQPPAPVPETGGEVAATNVQVQDREVGDYTTIYDDNSDSLTFMSDISTDLASEDDDNFVVVPMPACFKCDVPLNAVTEGSDVPSLIEQNKSGLDTKYLQELLDNTAHQKTIENSDNLDKTIITDNRIEHDELEKVILDLSDFNLSSADCNHLQNKDLASKLDGVKEAFSDKEPALPADGEVALGGNSEEMTPRSGMGDGVYVVDGSGHCTLLKKRPKHPDSSKSVFVFGSNGRLQKKSGDALRSSGKSKVGCDKTVYVVNDDGSCSLVNDENLSTTQPISENVETYIVEEVPQSFANALKVYEYSRECFRNGSGEKNPFISFGDYCSYHPEVRDNIPQNIADEKLADGTWKSSTKSSSPSSTTATGGNDETTYTRCFTTTSGFPSYSTAAYSMDTGLGGACTLGTGSTSNSTGITTTKDNNTVFSTAGVTGTEFTAANNIMENVSVTSSRTDYPHDCPLVRTYGSAAGLSSTVNNGPCFTVPDIGVGFSQIENCESGMAVTGIAPMTFTTAGNPAPMFSTSGVASTAVGNQRTGFIPSGNGQAYIIDPKAMALPPITNTLSVSPGEARPVDYYVAPSNYYEPFVFDDRFFAGPQAVRFGMQPSNAENNPTPFGLAENYFEPACCGPNTQPAIAETGTTTISSKTGGPTVDVAGSNQCHFDPTPAGCRPLVGHVAAFAPPPMQPAFSFVQTYRPYNPVPPSPVPVGNATRVVEAAPVQPVRLFPQGLLPGTISTASSVLSGVSNVLRNLYPWGRQEYMADLQNTAATATNLMHLQEMGFLDQEKNTALLHKYGNDLNLVVTELLAHREVGNNEVLPNICLG